ncbi:MAG: YciI family protein [Calditrichia bacterium]
MRFLRTPLIIFFISALLAGCQNTGQTAETENVADKQNSESGYDEALAKKLGADDYGMKPYVMAFLKAGPNRSQDEETAAKLQKAHLDNIKRMAEEGSLVLAGPFMDDGDIRGIYIFNVATIEEARALTETDPAIQAGRLVMELHPWYGTAALPVLKDVYPKLAKKSF